MFCRGYHEHDRLGWIYADADMVQKEYGAVTPETVEKAARLLESEVKEYDHYLTGQCYGFQLYKGEDEIESCWGSAATLLT